MNNICRAPWDVLKPEPKSMFLHKNFLKFEFFGENASMGRMWDLIV